MKTNLYSTNMHIQSLIRALFISFMILSSCSKQEKSLDISSEYVIIIPQNGCPGCIQKGFEFAQNHLDKECLTIVLTKISDLKRLKIQFGYDNINSRNVFLDTLRNFESKVEGFPRFFNSDEIIELDNSNLGKYIELEQFLSECE